MTGHRFSRVFASLGLAVSLTLSLVALPGMVLGALPDVRVGLGGVAQAYAGNGAIPTTVGPDEPVLVQAWAYNNDSSNVSQFYLSISGGGTLISATWTKSGGQSGTCSPTATYTCNFGQLKSKTSVVVSALFTAPSIAGSMVDTFTFSTTGLGNGVPDGDNSHGDTWSVSNSVAVDASTDFAGRYVTNNDQKIVKTGDTPSSSDRQTTIVYSPTTGIGVTVEDGSACSDAGCFGQQSNLTVGNGGNYAAFKVVVNLHSSEIPQGVSASNIQVFHEAVEITAKCGKTPTPECFSAKKFSWGIQVTIWLYHNGKITFA